MSRFWLDCQELSERQRWILTFIVRGSPIPKLEVHASDGGLPDLHHLSRDGPDDVSVRLTTRIQDRFFLDLHAPGNQTIVHSQSQEKPVRILLEPLVQVNVLTLDLERDLLTAAYLNGRTGPSRQER